jgi:hypothetical protein
MPKTGCRMSETLVSMRETAWGFKCLETGEQKRYNSKKLCDKVRALHRTKCFTCALNDMKEPNTKEDTDLKELARKMIINNSYEHSKVV